MKVFVSSGLEVFGGFILEDFWEGCGSNLSFGIWDFVIDFVVVKFFEGLWCRVVMVGVCDLLLRRFFGIVDDM